MRHISYLAVAILALLFVSSTSSFAIDLTKPIVDGHGVAARQSTDKDSPPVTIGDAIYIALLTAGAQRDPIATARRAALGMSVVAAKDMDFTADQVKEIEEGMTNFPPLWTLRVVEAIDPNQLKQK